VDEADVVAELATDETDAPEPVEGGGRGRDHSVSVHPSSTGGSGVTAGRFDLRGGRLTDEQDMRSDTVGGRRYSDDDLPMPRTLRTVSIVAQAMRKETFPEGHIVGADDDDEQVNDIRMLRKDKQATHCCCVVQ